MFCIFSEKSAFDAFFFMHAVKEGEYTAVLPLQRLWRTYVLIMPPNLTIDAFTLLCSSVCHSQHYMISIIYWHYACS